MDHLIREIVANDNPELAEDILGRKLLADRIARSIATWPDSRSCITAVYGEWGSGKSWLKTRIKRTLATEHVDTSRFVEISPWEEAGGSCSTDGLITTLTDFFNDDIELSTDKGKERSRLWAKFSAPLNAASLGAKVISQAAQLNPYIDPESTAAIAISMGHSAQMLEHAALSASSESETLSREEIRTQLSAALTADEFRPLIVIIDDLDRLNSVEIVDFVRMMKACLNLPNIHFLIFCDRKQVSSALDTISSGEGLRYLEKIVTHPIILPEIDQHLLYPVIKTVIAKISSSVNLPYEIEDNRLEQLWTNGLSGTIRTLRDTYRLCNALIFSVRGLTINQELEVDLIDLLAIDFLRLFAPTTYQQLISIGPLAYQFAPSSDRDDKEAPDNPEAIKLLQNNELPEINCFFILIFLQPKFSQHVKKWLTKRSSIKHYSYASSKVPAPTGLFRDPDYFPIFTGMAMPQGHIPISEVNLLFRDHSSITKTLKRWLEAKQYLSGIQQIKNDSITKIILMKQSKHFLYL